MGPTDILTRGWIHSESVGHGSNGDILTNVDQNVVTLPLTGMMHQAGLCVSEQTRARPLTASYPGRRPNKHSDD